MTSDTTRNSDHGRRRFAAALLLLGSTVGGASCGHFSRGQAGPEITYPLVVNNRSDFEVVVYAVPSEGSSGIRIGNARSLSTTRMAVPRNGLQGADVLVVRLHGIGSSASSRSWTSPATIVGTQLTAQLDIYSDASGNMRGTTLYTSTMQPAAHRP